MDDLIDRELRRALDVTPSPEFVARVRTKIAETPRPSVVPGFLKSAAAFACVAAVVITVGVRDEAGLKPSTTDEPSTTSVLSSTAYGPLATTPFQPRSGVAVPAGRSASPRAKIVKEPLLPEVLIAPENAAAVQQLVRNAHEFVVSVNDAPVASAWVMNDLTISPINIEPLESAAAHNN